MPRRGMFGYLGSKYQSLLSPAANHLAERIFPYAC